MNEPNEIEIDLVKELENLGVINSFQYVNDSNYSGMLWINGERPEKWCLDWLRKRGYEKITSEILKGIIEYKIDVNSYTIIEFWKMPKITRFKGTTDLACLLQAVKEVAKGEK